MRLGDFSDEERAVLIAGLEARRNQLRNEARPRPNNCDRYSAMAAREFYLAQELAKRIAVAP